MSQHVKNNTLRHMIEEAEDILSSMVPSRELSLVQTKLQEATYWTDQAKLKLPPEA